MLIALTRGVSPAMNRCELTHLQRRPIDIVLADRQHQAYQATLAAQGCTVLALAADAGLADSVFVEDTAIVLDEVAIVTRPGAPSRRPETTAVTLALASYRHLALIEAPATLDGGDVLVLGRDVFVGQGSRSNAHALTQLQTILQPWGYTVRGVAMHDCLHLKSAVTRVAPGRLLLNPAWVDATLFQGWDVIPVHPAEPAAANALLLETALIYPRHTPLTRQRLVAEGLMPIGVDISEFAKAEGGVSCCSIIFAA
ncbi:MAG: dimethylargininase [Chloroflexi bacterium]|nr:dimethylargininase [Chloroflexota bacterium]